MSSNNTLAKLPPVSTDLVNRFLKAAEQNDEKGLSTVFSQDNRVLTCTNLKGETALHRAAAKDSDVALKWLLSHPMMTQEVIDQKDKLDYSGLGTAIYIGNIAAVKILAAKTSLPLVKKEKSLQPKMNAELIDKELIEIINQREGKKTVYRSDRLKGEQLDEAFAILCTLSQMSTSQVQPTTTASSSADKKADAYLDIQLEFIKTAFSQSEFEKVIAECTKNLSKHPPLIPKRQHIYLYEYLIKSYIALKDYKNALLCFIEAIEKIPTYFSNHFEHLISDLKLSSELIDKIREYHDHLAKDDLSIETQSIGSALKLEIELMNFSINILDSNLSNRQKRRAAERANLKVSKPSSTAVSKHGQSTQSDSSSPATALDAKTSSEQKSNDDWREVNLLKKEIARLIKRISEKRDYQTYIVSPKLKALFTTQKNLNLPSNKEELITIKAELDVIFKWIHVLDNKMNEHHERQKQYTSIFSVDPFSRPKQQTPNQLTQSIFFDAKGLAP